METIISIVIILAVVGLILYLIGLLPIDATIKQIIHVLVIVLVIIWLLTLVVPLSGLHLRLR